MAAKVKPGLSRQDKEENAVRDAEAAKRELKYTYDCSPTALYSLVRAHRDVAHARTQLVSIGFHDSTRTRRLWSVVGKVEKDVSQASNRLAKCLVSKPMSGLAGMRKRRR